MSEETQNVMKKIKLEKVVLNMGVGKSGDAIDIARKALDQISGKKSNPRNAKKPLDLFKKWCILKVDSNKTYKKWKHYYPFFPLKV